MPEPRVMPGMILAYAGGQEVDGRPYEHLLYVASTRHAKSWTTATLRGFSGDGTGEVWATMDYKVRFPDHVVRDPFRVITSRDIKPRGGTGVIVDRLDVEAARDFVLDIDGDAARDLAASLNVALGVPPC